MSNFWKRQKVLLTGGTGFLGRVVLRKLQQRGCDSVFVFGSKDYDLVNRDSIRELLIDSKPTLILHLAARVGGIGANQANPARFFFENLMMGVQLIEEARLVNVEKFVAVGTICSYPKYATVPFKEEDLWSGYPEETNAPYGLAKKMLLVQLQAYRQQYGFKGVTLFPVNLYGPEDNFDLQTSHVIPALIRKFLEAKTLGKSEVEVWGTGRVSREFLYVDDAAEGILLAAEGYDAPEPVNLGSGVEITIRELAEMIAELCEYKGSLHWDRSKPDGQPRRMLDVSRAEQTFGFRAQMSFREGLKKTIDWYASEVVN